MKALRAAFPVILISAALTGCAVHKPSWPVCAAIGGAGGALLGSINDSTAAAWGGVAGAGLAGGYCWFYADSDGDGVLDRHDQCPDTPEGTKVDETGCPIVTPVVPVAPIVSAPAPLPKQETLVIHDLLFAFDSAELTAQDRGILDEAAKRLRTEAVTTRLVVTGHTDSRGSTAYNQRLSERRAHSVAKYLISVGIPKDSIVRVGGAGESKPVADNATEAGRHQNRRVEIDIQR